MLVKKILIILGPDLKYISHKDTKFFGHGFKIY
jgi:hypothetical protein